MQNVPNIANTVVDTCFPKGFQVISCKAKELMLALSGNSGGLEAVIQLIKHKFFESLNEESKSTAKDRAKPIIVRSGSGVQQKVTSDDMTKYVQFYGVGEF